MPVYDQPSNVIYPMGGGLNQAQPPTAIQPNEHPDLQNFYPFAGKLIRRGGVRRITSVAHTEALLSLFPFKKRAGDWTLIVGTKSGFGKLSNTGILAIPTVEGLVLVQVLIPWVMLQYNDVAYAVRDGAGSLFRVTPDVVMAAGIAKPSSAPVLAQNANPGVLAAGAYVGVYTDINLDTGAESDPSPASNTLALASLKAIDWSALVASTNPQVTHHNLYRSLIDQVNEYFYVATVPNQTTSLLSEDVLPQDMGDAASFENQLPPPGLVWAATFNERNFVTDGVDVFYSNLFNMEGFTGRSIPVFRDDGHRIRVLYPFGERLIIGKTNKVHFLIGTDRSSFRILTLSDKHGCTSGHSMKAAENSLFWLGPGPNFYRSDGNSVAGIGDTKIRRVLDAIPPSLLQSVVAETVPELGWYVAAVPNSTVIDPNAELQIANNSTVLVYNYRSDAWAIFTHNGAAPQFIAEIFDTNYARTLYGTIYNGHVYELYKRGVLQDEAASFPPSNISAQLLTKEESGGSFLSKAIRRVHVLCSSHAEAITLKAYRDGRTVPNASRTASLQGDQAWKSVNLSQLGDPGGTVQLGIEYSGTAALEIEAIGLDIEMIERHVGQPQ